MKALISSVILAVIISSCASADRKVCGPGKTEACPCPGQDDGTQTCLDDGSGWSECECPCLPDCDGKVCGDDGCGGECDPGCGEYAECDQDGQCPCIHLDCEGSCCAPSQVCSDGACCDPDCGERVCDPDPVCGTSCGDCATGEECTVTGECLAGCTPDCGDRVCGPDPVCQISCGDCPVDTFCTLDGECISGCVVDCTGLECGPDPGE